MTTVYSVSSTHILLTANVNLGTIALPRIVRDYNNYNIHSNYALPLSVLLVDLKSIATSYCT